MVRFIPREERFFDCFERQAAYLVDASRRLHDLVYVFSDQAAKAQAIKDLEHLGDQVTREMMTLLNQTFVTPIDREDIHALASRLDDVTRPDTRLHLSRPAEGLLDGLPVRIGRPRDDGHGEGRNHCDQGDDVDEEP